MSAAIDVKAIRARTGLSQPAFAKAFYISVGTLRNWEQGYRKPEGFACVLLQLIERYPDEIKSMLQDVYNTKELG